MPSLTEHQVEQGSEAWHALRLGIPTTSRFGEILTSTGKKASGQDRYLNELIGEWMTLKPATIPDTQWMNRGRELEPEAALALEVVLGVDLRECGFFTDGTVGSSPDRIAVDDSFLVEIKCPKLSTHVGYLRANKLPATYKPQVQGQMLLGGYQRSVFCSYHPGTAPLIVEVKRDAAFCDKLAAELLSFQVKLEAEKKRLIETGYGPQE
jgi:hypothetical protein